MGRNYLGRLRQFAVEHLAAVTLVALDVIVLVALLFVIVFGALQCGAATMAA
jgi:hypothetical protein